jgi:4-amino-4-deoxy-L-arabinose transferase-like glycosyltransferase
LTRTAPLWRDVLITGAVAAAVLLPWLGASGFAASEGHRVAPGWEFLSTHEWLVTRMFEQVYVRKPPGMPWAIALSAMVLGQTEFSARMVSVVSVVIAALATVWFARRWFGERAGMPAGLSAVLFPLLWSPGRSAEIESLHNLGVALGVLAMIDLLVADPTRRPRHAVVMSSIATVGVIVAGLAKGPAAVPCLVAAFLGVCFAARSVRPLAQPWAYVPLFLSAAALGALGALIARRLASLDETIVAQGPGEFLWASDRLVGVMTLMPVAFVSALPASLALLFPWGADAAREQAPTPHAFRIARAVAFAWLAAISLYVALGVSNPRYVMPAAAFLPPLVGWVLASRGAGFTAVRARIAGWMCLGAPVVIMVVMIAGGVVYAKLTTDARRADSGRALGRQVAELLPTGAVVIADHAVEARPEILLAAREHAESQGKVLRPIWQSGLNAGAKVLLPQAAPAVASGAVTVASRHFLLLRLDAGSNESQEFFSGADAHPYKLNAMYEGKVGTYSFGLFEVIHQKPEPTPP